MPRRLGGRCSKHQLPGVALPRACGRAGSRGGDQELDGARPEGSRIGAHRGERDALVARERDVVEPDDRHVARHPAACTLEPVDLLDRDGVVVCDDGGGFLAQLDTVEPTPRDGLRERTLAAFATRLAERTTGEREPAVTEALQVRDERVERTLLVDVDDPDPCAGLGAEAPEQHGNPAIGDVLGRARSGAQTGHEDGVDAALEEGRDLRALGLGIQPVFAIRRPKPSSRARRSAPSASWA